MHLLRRCNPRVPTKRLISSSESIRRNELGIQMIPEEWKSALFGASSESQPPPAEAINQVKHHLSSHGLWNKKNDKPSAPVTSHPPINIKLPELIGNRVSEHYEKIGAKYSSAYKTLVSDLCNNRIPTMPKEWNYEAGWTRYNENGSTSKIDYPSSSALVLDVEVCVKYNLPVLAVAVDGDHWYSWVHERLVTQSAAEDDERLSFLKEATAFPHEELIPIGASDSQRLIIGHNIGFDRSYMKEQYNLHVDKTRFLDTMSLHISLSGLTGYQRALSISNIAAKKRGLSEVERKQLYREKNQPDPNQWNDSGTLNNLKDVYAFYCKNSPEYQAISKDSRDIFVTGDMQDIRSDFQNLMNYCANDVKATNEIFRRQWPSFVKRFPHPITLAGMLEMSVTYLPVDSVAWKRYTSRSDETYQQVMDTMKLQLTNLASQACHLLKGDEFKKNLWLWDVSWKTVNIRYRKSFSTTLLYSRLSLQEDLLKQFTHKCSSDKIDSTQLTILSILRETEAAMKSVQPLLPGYPLWYIDLCSKYKNQGSAWHPGPHKLTTGIRIVPKLMKLTWDGYILHHTIQHGWGFLVPFTLHSDSQTNCNDPHKPVFPYEEYIKLVAPLGTNQDPYFAAQDLEEERMLMNDASLLAEGSNQYTAGTEWIVERPELRLDVQVPGCLFYKLPHKSGPEANVGNPLSRDFLHYIETGRLRASTGADDVTSMLLQMNKSTSYWRMSQKRILSQFVVSRPDVDPQCHESAILPRVVVAGAITRRAVEPTWLTASNAYPDRIGSELKSLIWSPRGWKFVGADVDSQELWLASVLGDAHFAGIHGCTGIGWMNLEGTRASGTDLHSKTASIVNITRNEAKVLNYARIYGAGKAFAARFLKQSNPSLTAEEAECKARDIYKQTKGVKSNGRWKGGSESYLFNCLEKIALEQQPRTPVLSCSISKALEREDVKREFMTSIINWVVQSSAVDFLHIMLVTMKWLFEQHSITGRFSISIHDEVRYLVREEDKYRAALALQITNLLTRAFVCQQIGMNDLPASIAFFSSVEIDSVLRKDASTDAVTPSNQSGLQATYGIGPGESLDIVQLVEKLHHERGRVQL